MRIRVEIGLRSLRIFNEGDYDAHLRNAILSIVSRHYIRTGALRIYQWYVTLHMNVTLNRTSASRESLTKHNTRGVIYEARSKLCPFFESHDLHGLQEHPSRGEQRSLFAAFCAFSVPKQKYSSVF